MARRQGYEPEAQVTQKGEIALRGILDLFPPTSRGRCGWNFLVTNWNHCATSIRSHNFGEEILVITLPPAVRWEF